MYNGVGVISMAAQEQEHTIVVKSGERFPVNGYYSYDGHIDNGSKNCYFSPQETNMRYKKGELAPRLGSCPHEIKWVLIKTY